MLSTRVKLCVMMFLEFFIWGAWLPKIFGYLDTLKFDPLQQGLILNAFALASFAAMFFSTQFADRNFSAEKFLAFSHLVGGAAILAPAWVDRLLAVLRAHLVHCLLLRADDLGHQLHRLRQPEGPAKGLRAGADVGHGRLGRGELAVRLHPGRRRRRVRGSLDLPGGRRRLLRAGRLQPDPAAHAAKAGRRGGRAAGLAGGDEAVAHAFHFGAVRGHFHGYRDSSVLLHMDRQLSQERRHPRQLGHAHHEHRPGRRDRDHGGARRRAEVAGLETP